MNSAIEFDNVSIKRGGALIWSDGTFSINQSEVVAVIGSNGSGKTTLIQMVLGLLTPTTGRITTSSSNLGYVPQECALEDNNAIRAVDLVSLGRNGAHLLSMKDLFANRKTDKVAVQNALRATDSASFSNRRFSELSGGQQQRIMIASAIVNRPDILILDEPLSALDIVSAREIVALIKDLNTNYGMTILIVAHDLGLLLPVLTSAVYLVDGHAHYNKLDDADHNDFGDLLEHLTTLRVGDHNV
jgi:zinc/manganese transport system ATP-binding protein